MNAASIATVPVAVRSPTGRLGRRRVAFVVVGALSALFWLAANAVPAFASCGTDKPAKSQAAFVGVVTSTASDGRVATVQTDTGAIVTVIGTPDTGSAATSVDRTYQVGGRYEFHPINDASPFEDNVCTATRLLSQGPVGPGKADRRVAVVTAVLAAAAAAAFAVFRRRTPRRA